MGRSGVFIGLAVALATPGSTLALDTTIAAKLGIVKPLKLAKLVSKSAEGFALPTGAAEDPTVNGAEISFFDTGISGGSFTQQLPAAGWTGLGNPAGSKGFKYKGSLVGDTVCKTVQIKPTVIKAVCKGSTVTLTTPFLGNDGALSPYPR